MSRPRAQLDIECLSNWFLVGITDVENNIEWDFQQIDGYPLDVRSIETLLRHYTIETFNGQGYDVPMLAYALTGASCAQLKLANDAIIVRGMKWWEFYRNFNCWAPDYIDHIDVSEPTPGVKVSLKQYACRMSFELVQDSPVDFNKPLPLEQIPHEIYYCRNDRKVTAALSSIVGKRLALREKLSAKYGVDLRSKSDAQMAEAVVKKVWTDRMLAEPHLQSTVDNISYDRYGVPKIVVPKFAHGTSFKVKIPEYVEFVTPYMRDFLDMVRNVDFVISDKEEAIALGYDDKNISTGVQIPAELKGRDILIGKNKYRVGIGGLHSQESSIAYRSVPGFYTLRTADVTSYYPSLILNAGMVPPQLGKLFLDIYGGFYDDRVSSKAALQNRGPGTSQYDDLVTIVDGVKIFLNGTFGKLFSRFSIFYAPQFGIAVTIGGQLSLLMLIERLTLSGIHVVSANTDGIEIAVPAGREAICEQILQWWQSTTRLGLEGKNYAALFSRDVNNYVSIDFSGKPKRKGYLRESGVLENKHPDLDICADAVVEFLTKRIPLANTIMQCQDIRKFIRVRGAKGGAGYVPHFGAEPVHCGRAVRWYYSKGSQGHIIDMASGNKVAGSDQAMPAMRLPTSMPADVDHAYYIARAEEMLSEVGYNNIQVQL